MAGAVTMQLKVYHRDNRKRDARRWRRMMARVGYGAGAVLLAVAFYQFSGPVWTAVS
jgi:hypothetical protein